jgi:signal transduction histidine kinase
MFDKNSEAIPLMVLNGWVFRQGNDVNWSKKEIDTTSWVALTPSQPTIKNAIVNGKFEGWFRLRFMLDGSFKNRQTGITAYRWAATDIYLDGNLIVSYGNTGVNGKPYEENREALPTTQSLHLEPGKEYILAVHIVDFINPLNHRFLKSESVGKNFDPLLMLTGPLTYKKANDEIAYFFLYTGINGFLSILFWFLYWQNRQERNLLFISISTSLYFLWPLLLTIAWYPLNLEFNTWWLTFFIAVQLWPLAMAAMVYTVGQIFNFRFKNTLGIAGILFVIYSSISTYIYPFEISFSLPPLIITLLLLLIVLSSWKKLKGAQWAIVAGTLFTAIFSYTWSSSYKYQSGMYLSFPVSLMIYVAMRFKEILNEVQVSTKRVVQLSEEKKQQAVKQQKILEEEVARQTIELRTSLENLKSTQAQLIQSEKMASLGELTAGIAHEIQNPLNFVNNFSEVNKELAQELKSELAVGNFQSATEIAGDIQENSEKINNHGKRADAIVKGMLQHSRKSEGIKESTGINALCDEYLRLSYHGLRAKDKSFNVTLKTDYDERVGKINIIPQDFGRALLNVYNNAFYAVIQKSKQGDSGYEPTVIVGTKKNGANIEVTVIDNGIGISQKIVDKIFQPFFTTKPTGEGTGLGLSLAYDIVKTHGGDIKVKSKENEGSEFIINLSIPSI